MKSYDNHSKTVLIDKKTHSNNFILDEKINFSLINSDHSCSTPQWVYPAQLSEPRYSLRLASRQTLITCELNLCDESIIFLRIASIEEHTTIINSLCNINFIGIDNNENYPIAQIPLGKENLLGWREIQFDLKWLPSKLGKISIEHYADLASTPNSLAIADLCVTDKTTLKHQLARTHHTLRIKNELEHFSATYRDNFYKTTSTHNTNKTRTIIQSYHNINHDKLTEKPFTFNVSQPLDGENAYNYAYRLLAENLDIKPPDFINHLRQLAEQGKTVRILSLCCGAARIEASYAAAVPHNIEWTLLDINEDLLQMAAEQFADSIPVNLLKGDVNQLQASHEKWDIILCVSALHHVVELEQLMRFIYDSLHDNGEFWSIGEAVGRNGNRLWPHSKRLADQLFSELPAQYRLNAYTQKIDNRIPDQDFSIASFEGIRSEDILENIYHWFNGEEVYLTNCFLWRILDQTYHNNYHLNLQNDRDLIIKIVKAEINHYRDGGKGTALFARFKPRIM